LKELPEAREDALSASLHCTIANMIVVELAKHLAEGVEPYDALRLAAIGSLPLRPSKGETLRLLANMARTEKAPET
jgi:antirestriction protein ArdC